MVTALLNESPADIGETESKSPKHHNISLSQLCTGSELFFKALINEGVDTIFGYPGGKVLGLYDKMLDFPQIKHVLVSHEQGGTHAADGYARVTGKPGVVITTSGPGATNTITGIANAEMDSIPLVVFTGQVEMPLIGKKAFQESNIIDITRPITKYSYQVPHVDQLVDIIHQAFYIATSGNPGPVVVDLPKDILVDTAYYSRAETNELNENQGVQPDITRQIKQASELIKEAERPLIYAGGGVVLGNAGKELVYFAQKANIPVTTTLMGLGAFPEKNPLSLGMLGMHGTWYANMAVHDCDLLIAMGARFDDRVTGELNGFSPKSRKIHVDIDPSCIGKNVAVDIPIIGHVKPILQQLTENIVSQKRDRWLATITDWKQNHPLIYEKSKNEIKPQYIIEQISKMTKGNAIIVTDVGQHQMWAAQFYEFIKPRSLVTSGGLGTMGFGLPAAIGASVANPNATVVCISGDGGFRMTSCELSTAVHYGLPIKIVIINNGGLGMVRQWQRFFFNRRYSHSNLKNTNPDFIKLAKSYGAIGLRAQKPEEVDFVLKKAFDIKNRPVVMEFAVSPDEDVYPMVSPGKCLHEMEEYK